MPIQDEINRVFRNFRRYTGDGLPGEPTNAPAPIGDPNSGVHNPKKEEIRAVLGGVESSAVRAEEAAEAAEAALSSISTTSFASKAAAQAYNPLVAPGFIQLAGFSAPGDNGGALYKRVGSEPAHSGKFQIAQGSWYELATNIVTPETFGQTGGADDSAVFNAALAFLAAIGGGTLRAGGRYRLRNINVPTKTVVDLHGAEITALGGGASNQVFRIVGSASGVRRPIANVARGSILVTCSTPSHAGGFAAGDYVLVQNEVFASPGNYGKNQEIARVAAVNAATGAVSFEVGLVGTYTGSTPTIENITPVVGSHIRGGTSVLADASAAEGGHVDFDLCVGCSIEGMTIDGVNNLPGVTVRRSQSIDVARNIIRNGHRRTLGGYAYGISVQESSVAVTVHQNKVTGMREVMCTDRSRFVIFSENIILGAYLNGINAHSSTNENISIVNNHIYGVIAGVAISFGQGSGSNYDAVGVISGNIIKDTFSDGIQIAATSSTTYSVIVSNNIISGFGQGISNASGIYVNYVENLTVSGNQVVATGALGNAFCIFLANLNKAQVVNNILQGGSYGVGLSVCTKVRVQSNSLESNSVQCVRVANPDSSFVWILDNQSNASNQSINGTGTYQNRNSWNLP